MFDTLAARMEDGRVILTGRGGNALLTLSLRLEGRKVWLKAGGFSFEATPINLERLQATFPGLLTQAPEPEPGTVLDWSKTPTPDGIGHIRRPYQLKTTPYPFQEKGTARSAFLEAFALLGEMGTGKSKILIDSAGQLWAAGKIDAVLIIALKGVHAQWIEEQIPDHLGETVPWQGAANTLKKPLPPWDHSKLCVLSVNFDYAKGKAGFNACKKFIAEFGRKVMIIVDESHEIKNMSSKVTEYVNHLGGMCDYRRIATGTPIGKNLVDALSQFQFLDERILGHRYKTSFQAEYCHMGGHHMQEVVGSKNEEQFWARVAPYSFRITKEEADLGLPPKNYDKFAFELSDEQRHHYDALKADMITRFENGELMTVKNSISLLVRLQQVACGFLSVKGDKELGIPDKLQYLKNARIEALARVLEEREGKTVIWARFNEDIKAISDHLGKGCVTYYGATSSNDRDEAKRRFLDPNDPVTLVANPAAGGTGLNLQGTCRTVIYYSNSFDAIARWQSEDRVHRIGMKFPITYIDLVARNTIDRRLLANLRAKKSLAELALDDIRRMVEDT